MGHGAGRKAPFRQHEELSQLQHLHTLRIPYASLLGWSRQEDCVWDWHKMLPTSLREIDFIGDLEENFYGGCWKDESLLPVFLGLLSWFVASSLGTKPGKFGSEILQSSCEFTESYQQRSAGACEEHGILCSIEKPRPDRPRPWVFYLPPGRGRGRGRGRESVATRRKGG
jgi:hypothetical protein